MSGKLKAGAAAVAVAVGVWGCSKSLEDAPDAAAPPTTAAPPTLADTPPVGRTVPEPVEPPMTGPPLMEPAAAPGSLARSEIPAAEPRLPGGKEIVRVYYGTNRDRAEDADGQRNPDDFYGSDPGPLEFGVLEVSIPGRHQAGEIERPRWYTFEREDAAKHVVLQRVVPVDESLFLRELRADVARDAAREAFVFVHGFNVEFAEAAWRAGQMKADLEFGGPAVLYSWPSLGLPDPISYGRDQDRAADSRGALMRFLEAVAVRSGAERLHVIAHSMGNELLVPALAALREDPRLPRPLFDELILAAPDIDAAVFRDDICEKLDRAAERTTVYAADHDAALIASAAINRTLRLGMTRGIFACDKDCEFLDLVDASPVRFRFFELGHSDYGGPLLEDVRAVLAGVPCGERSLEKYGRVPRGWTVVEAAATPAGGSVTAAPPPPAKAPTLWARLTGWWPF